MSTIYRCHELGDYDFKMKGGHVIRVPQAWIIEKLVHAAGGAGVQWIYHMRCHPTDATEFMKQNKRS